MHIYILFVSLRRFIGKYTHTLYINFIKSMSKLAIELKKLLLVVLALWTFVPWGSCAYAQGTSNSKEQVTKAPDGKQRTVSGTVRDEQGEELVGVPIRIGNGQAVAITNEKGFYSVKVPTKACQLKFSYVGMKEQQVSLASGTKDLKQDVVMKDNNALHDVVVTGIFSKARESYTGAVSTINKEELKLHKGQNLLQTLKTIDASLNFQVNNLAGSNHLDNDLEAYRKRLIDRFGTIPDVAEELIRVVPLRVYGKQLGIEKIMLKQGHMYLYFVSNPDSPYFQSEAFGRILNYVSNHPRRCNFREANGKRSVVISPVASVGDALTICRAIATD